MENLLFITDCIAGKEAKVEYCPTCDMLADLFTKPLQGSLFIKCCDLILNSVFDSDKKYNQDAFWRKRICPLVTW